MSGDELTRGVLLAALPAAAAAFAALRIRRAWLAHLRGLDAVLALSLLGVLVLTGIHLLPLAAGILSRASVLVTAALVVAAALLLPQRDASPDPGAPPAPPSGRASWVLAAVAGGAVFAGIIDAFGEAMPHMVLGGDSNTFHLPQAGRWIDTGSLWQIDEFAPREQHGYYPGGAVLLFVWTLLALHNDALVQPTVLPFFALWAAALWAAGRELRIPPATRVLITAALLSIPVVGESAIPRAFLDIVLWATVTCSVAFGLRHARTGRTSDLVLAGIGLGLGAATKWYGLTTAVAILGGWALARVVARVPVRAALRDAALAAGPALAICVPWLLRNAVESGNPIFPQRVAIGGLTLLDAPRDVVREQVGFSIADYATSHVLADRIVPDLLTGLGWQGVLALGGALAAALLAGRRSDRALMAVAVCTLAVAAAYLVTPYTALGARDRPVGVWPNSRYAVPAIVLGLLCLGTLARGAPTLAIEVALAIAALVALDSAYDVNPAEAVGAALLRVLVFGAIGFGVRALARRARRPRIVWAVVSGVGILAVLTNLHDAVQRREEHRYAFDDPALQWIQAAAAPLRIGVSGVWPTPGPSPVWASFGNRIQNTVRPLGPVVDGFLEPAPDAASWARAARGSDVVIVGRGAAPTASSHSREERFADAAGLKLLTRSYRFALYEVSAATTRSPAAPSP